MKKSILYSGSIVLAVALVFASASMSLADTTITSAGTPLTTVEPALSIVAVANSTDGTSATITWTTDEPSTSEIAYGIPSPVVTATTTSSGTMATSTTYSLATPVDSTMVNNHSVTLFGLTPGTVYHFQIISGDMSGNTTSSSDETFTTNSTAPVTTASTTAPMILSIGTSNSNDGTSSVITWVTDQPSTSQVSYGLTAGSYTASTAADSTLVTSHSVTLSGLTPHTSYHFIVSSANGSAMMSTSTDQVFITNAGTSTAATTTAANFVLTATTSNTSFTTGSPISITATAENTGADIGQGIVSVEVYDSSNNRVFDQAFNQDFSTNNPLSYTISFTPSNPDTYTVKLGTFSSDWSRNYAWNNNALSFTVTGSSISGQTSTSTTSTSGSTLTSTTSFPNMTLTPTAQTVSAGQHVDFNGRNFPHEENINVFEDGTLVGTAHADGGGNFTTGSIVMPSTSGIYTYTFVGVTTGAQMSSTITVQ